MLWEWRGIANMDFIQLGGSSRVDEMILARVRSGFAGEKIILIGIDNDIYSISDACPNACEMWKAIERLKQGESINVQDKPICVGSLENSHHRMVNHLNRNTQEWQRKSTNLPTTTLELHQAPVEQIRVILQESTEELGNVRNLNEKRMQLITRRRCYCELEAHYLYMAQIQEVTPDAVDNSGSIFDAEPLQKVQHDDDNYNVFSNEREHPEQPESVNDTYPDEYNIIIDSLDMSHDRELDDQDDNDDLVKERDLLDSLIEKLKCEIDDSKNRKKLLESSNKILVDKLTSQIEDLKNTNKSLESSNTCFKEANNKLSKTNQLMFKDLKKFQDELEKRHDMNYMSKVELECAKAKTKLIFVKPEFLKKAQRANPRLYDIGCYNDNLALMLAPESDETIHLAQESRSKLKEMVVDLKYFNSLENEIESLQSQLVTQRTQFLNEIDRLSKEYYYVDHMNAILGVYTTLDDIIDLQCDYVDQVVKCERLEKELLKVIQSQRVLKHFNNMLSILNLLYSNVKNR
ncbi:hypothetical protein Tco_1086403 [Tanacetum coccineum]